MKIAIIGAGKMGVWFAKFFNSKGYSVTLADRKKEKIANLKKELPVRRLLILKKPLLMRTKFYLRIHKRFRRSSQKLLAQHFTRDKSLWIYAQLKRTLSKSCMRT